LCLTKCNVIKTVFISSAFNFITTHHPICTPLPGWQSHHSPSLPDTFAEMPGLVSASGILGFLSEEEPELKVFALQTLNDDIDTLWTEVAGSVGQM
jgi:hypothetical protein